MRALEQGLMLAAAPSIVEAKPAAAAGVPTAPAAPPPNPGGALGQAMAIQGAARQAMAADPLQMEVSRAAAADQADREAAARAIEANMAKAEALRATPDPPRPSIPRLEKLPEAPEPVQRDPLRVFGQFLPVVAALGALTTREPAINALNAATAMVNAAKANDKEEEDKQRRAWIDNLNLTVKNNESLLTEYKLALDDRNTTVAEKLANINAIAAQNRDYVMLAGLKGGRLDSLVKYVQMQNAGTAQLATLATTLSEQQLQRDRLQQQEIYQWAQLEIDRRKLSQVSMGDAIGPILLKIQNSGKIDPKTGRAFNVGADGKPLPLDQVLNPGDLQALKLYMDINRQGAYSDQPGAAAAAPGTIPGLTPAPAPAAAARPAPDNSAARAAPPVTAPGPAASITAAPQDPKARKVGTVYGTPQGNLKWLGNGQWERVAQ